MCLQADFEDLQLTIEAQATYAKALAKRCPQDFRRPLAACAGVLVLRALSRDVNGLLRKLVCVENLSATQVPFRPNRDEHSRKWRLNLGSW